MKWVHEILEALYSGVKSLDFSYSVEILYEILEANESSRNKKTKIMKFSVKDFLIVNMNK